jgi:hypothetical protein
MFLAIEADEQLVKENGGGWCGGDIEWGICEMTKD